MKPLPKSDWAHLIPHQGGMCLLDCVIEWSDQRIHARTDSHRSTDNPLRSDGILRAVHLCEYGAQSMAVHGALRAVKLGLARIDDLDGSLDVFGERLLGGESSWQYAFRIEHAGNEIASGRAAVMLNPGSS